MIVVPFELVKIRLQDKSQAHLYRGPTDVVRAIVKQSGWGALYNGLWSTMVRHILWNGGYFATIFRMHSVLPKATTSGERVRNSLVSGTVGGFIGTVLNTPADVVKTRIQNVDRVQGVAPKYRGTFSGIALIGREEGLGALYKGFTPKVLRLAPGGGILLLVVEVRTTLLTQAVSDHARRWLGPPYIAPGA